MTEEAEKLLLEKIERLEAIITHSVKEDKPSAVDFLLEKLGEQGTQRGLIIIFTAILANFFSFDQTVVTDILTGAAMIYGTHDVVTKG